MTQRPAYWHTCWMEATACLAGVEAGEEDREAGEEGNGVEGVEGVRGADN